jgi:hypothetical protein
MKTSNFILNSTFITKFFGFEPWHFIVVVQDKELCELIKPVAWELLKIGYCVFILYYYESANGKHDSAYIMSMMKDVKKCLLT